MAINPPDPYVPRGKITWGTKETKKEEPYTPNGKITWGRKEEPYQPKGKVTWGSKPTTEETGEVGEAQRMRELDEALAREDAQRQPQQEDLGGVFVAKLKDREGVKQEAYLDSLGKPTGGVGHLLSEEELKTYPVGSKIPQEVVDGWLVEDSAKALRVAQEQAEELGGVSEDLVVALASVNFQLGTSWNKEHKGTWSLLKEGKYKEAAEEAANSTWNKQTPKRVKDFQEALLKEAEKTNL